MKIRTITCSNVLNYGARLQASALAEYLCELGHDAQVIDYRPSYSITYPIAPPSKRSLREWISWIRNYSYYKAIPKRREVFEAFAQRHGHLTSRTYHSITDLRNNPPQADVYIAGSDQIWNPTAKPGRDDAFYLRFGNPDVRRIAYSASFGISDLTDEHRSFLSERLKDFDSISVREQSGTSMIASMGLPAPAVVVDPVFLLRPQFWEQMAASIEINEPYVLVYDFLNSPTAKAVAKRLAKATGCRIIAVGHRNIPYAYTNFTSASPENFLGLIKGATCVVSNSFHAAAFAIIFCRPFINVDREDGLNERMHNLLKSYGLTNRLAGASTSAASMLGDIDYNAVWSILDQDIDASKKFLSEILS